MNEDLSSLSVLLYRLDYNWFARIPDSDPQSS